jgi:hypothetical protein
MPKILTAEHAELLGSTVVEPGDEIPDDADDELVARLEAEGKIADAPKKTTKKED